MSRLYRSDIRDQSISSYSKELVGWPTQCALCEWINPNDNTLHEELEILVDDRHIYQEEIYIEMIAEYDEKHKDPEIKWIWVNDERIEISNNLIVEININGEVNHVDFEWLGAKAEDHERVMTYKRDMLYMQYRDRFNQPSWWEWEYNEKRRGSIAWCKCEDEKAGIKPVRKKRKLTFKEIMWKTRKERLLKKLPNIKKAIKNLELK